MESTSTLEKDEHRELPPSSDGATTEVSASLVATSDRCPNCGARMAPDQRYCIECGERRSGGGLRDALPRTQTTAVAAAPPPRRPRMSANSSLIAGIATLLIALGVGVLIGRTGDHSNKAAGTTPIVVNAPAAGTATTTAGSAATNTTSGSKSSAKKSKTKNAAAGSGGTVKDASGKTVKLPPKVVKVGGKCTTGTKGCSKGKFTGSFFGQ